MSDTATAHGGKSVWRVEELLQRPSGDHGNEFRPLWDWQDDDDETDLELESENSKSGDEHPFLPDPALPDQAAKPAEAGQGETPPADFLPDQAAGPGEDVSSAEADELAVPPLEPEADLIEAVQPEAEATPEVEAPPAAPPEPVVDTEALRRERDAGYEEGYRAGCESLRQQMEEQQLELRALMASLGESMADQRQFFAPMERLAIHLAEQLLRGELNASGQAIRRLVENALADLGGHRGRVVVRLNPDDLLKFRRLSDEPIANIELMADRGLGRGSVRLEMDDGMVEDLVENRLDALAASLLGPGAKVRLPSGGSRRPFVVEGTVTASDPESPRPMGGDNPHVHTLGEASIAETVAPSPILIEADALMDEGTAGHGFEA